MELILISWLYSILISAILYYYFFRFHNANFRWYGFLIYIVASCGLIVFQMKAEIGEFLYVILEILLLTVCGIFFQKCDFKEAFALSSLEISVYSIVNGIMQSVTYWGLSLINQKAAIVCVDFINHTVIILLLIFTFHIVEKSFSGNVKSMSLSILLILIIPVLFITLVEAVVSDSIYGHTIVWNTESGLVSPIVNNMQVLVLRLFAYGGLFSVLIAYKKLKLSIENEQTIHLLEQQTQNQEVYVREAKFRYEQTRSFRHDIKNHLLVLHQLIKDGDSKEASKYLENMNFVSGTLSFQVHTGNIAVDALMSSKLSVAAQKGIRIHCSMVISEQCCIEDMDWCIILSNALDNAIEASETIDNQDRWIYVSGNQKGNVYLLNVENCCRQNTNAPSEGIGLSNIRAVLKKYNGKMNIEVVDTIFKLNVLFIIPHHLEDIPQQFY